MASQNGHVEVVNNMEQEQIYKKASVKLNTL